MAAVSQFESGRFESGWRAQLDLAFERRAGRTVLSSRKHVGPLIVQRPFYPEGDVCHVYVVHPPGGVVGGDRLHLRALVAQYAHALITTPAATKFYRALPDRSAVLEQVINVHGSLEWLPQENIFFDDANAWAVTRFNLDKRARLIAWELNCYGRPASNLAFKSGRVLQHLDVHVDAHPTLLDHLCIDGAGPTMTAPWGLARHAHLGTVLAYPVNADVLELAREHAECACTVVDGLLVCRAVAHEIESLKAACARLWSTLRPHIVGREAVAPRIWAT